MNLVFRFLLLALSLLLVSCAATVESKVTRFHRLPAKGSGQTFKIQSTTAVSGIEFSSYAGRVAAHFQNYGWVPSTASARSDYTVHFSYGITRGRLVQGVVPIIGQTGGGTTFHTGVVSTYGHGHRPGYGSFAATSYTAPTYGVVGTAPYSETVYDRYLDMNVRDRSGQSVFEGRAISTGTSAEIAEVLPAMIDSLFTGFPGESGKTKRVEKASR
jgi:hypothetical protein